MSTVKIISGQKYIEEIVKLFKEYKQAINVDVSFQPADETATEILIRYSEPQGKLYVALVDDEAAGCIAFHPMENNIDCELKRLYVRPQFRGLHIGKLLIERAIEDAKNLNYRYMYLDTLTTLKAACHMYEQIGFKQIEAYYYNPLPNVCYYKLNLKGD